MNFNTVASVLGLLVLCWVGAALIDSAGTPDMRFHWMNWIEALQQQGLRSGYALTVRDNYPPLSAALLWVGSRVLGGWGIEGAMAVKYTLLGFLVLSSVIYGWLSRSMLLTMIFIAANLVASIGLAYLDILLVPCMLLAFLCLQKQRLAGFLFFYLIAVFIKWQPIIMAPFVMLVCWRYVSDHHYGWRAMVSVLVTPAVVVGSVVWLFGAREIAASLQLALNTRDFSANAMNVNGIINELVDVHANRVAQNILQQGGDEQAATARYMQVMEFSRMSENGWPLLRYWLSKLIFFVGYLYFFWQCARLPLNNRRFLLSSALMYVFYFVFNTGVHENHLHMALLLVAILVAQDLRFLSLLVWLSALYNLNVIYFYGVTGVWPEDIVLATTDTARPAMLLGFLVVIALLWLLHRYNRMLSRSL